MNERELRSGIAAIDYLLQQIDAGNSMETLRQSQQQRKAELQERLRLLTTCHCGQGKQDLQYENLTHCFCNSKLI